jgi:hypothetical protein
LETAGVVALVAVGVVIGAYVASVLAAIRGQKKLPPAPPVQPPEDAKKTETGFEFFDRALREAPERFAEARRIEEVRRQIACCVCSEPTAIVCPGCDKRVCSGHREDHPCQEK